tara:strand:- start:1157 stop:1354 length:198 start_codon:yes stop_codon:yes gene_type:complete
MIIEVKKFPESKAVAWDSEWFPIAAGDADRDPIGSHAMARILHSRRVGTSVKKKEEIQDENAKKR